MLCYAVIYGGNYMNDFTKRRDEYFNKLKSNSALLTNFIKNSRCIEGKKIRRINCTKK